MRSATVLSGKPVTGGDARLEGLAAAVRARRRNLGLPQDDLAALAGCSERFVHTVEAAKPTLRLDKVLDVLAVLGLGLAVVAGNGAIVDGAVRDEEPHGLA